MITLKDFMETVEYRITEGSDYLWHCFGNNAYSLSAWNGDYDGWSFNVTFSTECQEVFMVEACDYKRKKAYRYFNPQYKDAYFKYAGHHNKESMNQAWDDVDYVDLESQEDWLDKARSIVSDKDYDIRVSVPLELSDEEMFQLMKMAHERDITLNKLVEDLLWEVVRKHEKETVSQLEI